MPDNFFEGVTAIQLINSGVATLFTVAVIIFAFKFTPDLIGAWNNLASAITSIQGNCVNVQAVQRQEFEELKQIGVTTLRTVERIDTQLPLMFKGGN